MKIIMVYTMWNCYIARNDENPGCAGDGSTHKIDFQSRSSCAFWICSHINLLFHHLMYQLWAEITSRAHLCMFMGEKKSKANSDSLHPCKHHRQKCHLNLSCMKHKVVYAKWHDIQLKNRRKEEKSWKKHMYESRRARAKKKIKGEWALTCF